MKQSTIIRTLAMGLFLVALSVTMSYASTCCAGKHIKLKGNNGKVYQVTTDNNGNFSFTNVEPGNYQLVWVLPNGTTPDNTQSCSIEISSFSWGATSTSTGSSPSPELAQGKSTPVTRSNISNNRGGTQPTPELAQGKSTQVTRSNISNNRSGSQLVADGSSYYTIVLQDVMVTSMTTATGTVKTAKATPKLAEAVAR